MVHRLHVRARKATRLVPSFPGKSPAEPCMSHVISILMSPYSNFESCATAAGRKFNFPLQERKRERERERERATLLNTDCKEDNVDPRLRFNYEIIGHPLYQQHRLSLRDIACEIPSLRFSVRLSESLIADRCARINRIALIACYQVERCSYLNLERTEQ